ncbi:MAG: hypothetical protein EOO38_30225 [Cytophagaceae bacterium]|nr:MAG: hypothetical protein EOO38_30225 [Cytophagaceae bacterium]
MANLSTHDDKVLVVVGHHVEATGLDVFAEDLVDRAYITRVHARVPDADVRFPLDELLTRRAWTESNRVPFQPGAHNEHAFTFTVLDRTR